MGGGYFTAGLRADGDVVLRGMGATPQHVRVFKGPWLDLAAGSYQLFLLNVAGQLFVLRDVREPETGLSAVSVPFSRVHKSMFASGHDFTVVLDASSSAMYRVESDVLLKAPANVHSVCSGGSYAMALTEDGQLWGHGSNVFGQLAQGNHVRHISDWVQIPPLGNSSVKQVACGGDHVLALTQNGELYSWGWFEHGQLGIGRLEGGPNVRYSPNRILLQNVTAIAAGGYATSMAIMDDGSLMHWGWDEVNGDVYTPTKVEGIHHPVIGCASGSFKHTSCLDETGQVIAFGNNFYTQVK